MANELPLVSVLMTAYNREMYVGEAIESVLASTYVNFELIIVDDSSKDKTLEIARHYATKDARIKLYSNETNLGDYPNRNKAASFARGKYLKYIDSDDLIYPHGLEIFVSTMEKYPNAALCIGSNRLQNNIPLPICIPRTEALRFHFFKQSIFNTGPTGVMILTAAFNKIGGFSGKRMVGDTELWLALSCLYDVVITFPSLVYWREHEGQEFLDGVRSGLYSEMSLELISELMNKRECTLSRDERNKVVIYNRKVTARFLLKRLITKGELVKTITLSKKLKLNLLDYCKAVVNIQKGLNS